MLIVCEAGTTMEVALRPSLASLDLAVVPLVEVRMHTKHVIYALNDNYSFQLTALNPGRV